jgi:hypothetical protein
MKTLIFTALLLAGWAHAGTVNLTCTGKLLAPGAMGQSGPVTIAAATNASGTWTLDVGFQGSSPILTGGEACGAPIATGLICQFMQVGPTPFSLRERCGPVVFNTGFPRADVEASLVLDEDHGSLYCSNRSGGVTTQVELSDCH